MKTDYKKPEIWSNPLNKLYEHQVGFTAPPGDFEFGPTDFLRIAPDSVGVSSRLLHLSGYQHTLDERQRNFHLLEEVAECMANAGADVIGQVGTNWSHTGGKTPSDVRDICKRFSDTYSTPFHMMGLAAADALHEIGARKIAVNTVYYWPDWTEGMIRFLRQDGFDVVRFGNLVDLGAFATQEDLDNQNFVVDEAVIFQTMERLAAEAPDVDAYYITGALTLRPANGGPNKRIVHLDAELEALVKKPVVASDTALYWRIFKTLGIGPVGKRGSLLSGLQ